MSEPGSGQQAELVERDSQCFMDKRLAAAHIEDPTDLRHGDQNKLVQTLFLLASRNNALFTPVGRDTRSELGWCASHT